MISSGKQRMITSMRIVEPMRRGSEHQELRGRQLTLLLPHMLERLMHIA